MKMYTTGLQGAKLFKVRLSRMMAAVMAATAVLGLSPTSSPGEGVGHAMASSSAEVELAADYAIPDGKLIRTEQFNNTNYTPLPVHVVDELKGIRTKVVRDFVKINWYYNKDANNPDYLAYSINDPDNLATNPDLQHGRKETYDFMGQFSESLMLTLGYSYGGASNPGKNRLIAGESEMNWSEFDAAMKTIIMTLKQKNPKLEYIEVGNEPNLEPAFYGHELNVMEHTDDKPGYMRMYQGMSEAVLWVNEQLGLDDTFQEGQGKRIKVGGPVLSGYDFAKQKEFVNIAYREGYRVDFVSWHRYRTQTSENETQELEMKRYLRQYYPEAITVVSEYGWKGGGGLSDSTNNIALAKQAAFMTDSAYYYEKGGTDIPMNWVAVHTLNAYFKNQFDVDYALSSGNIEAYQSFDSGYEGPVRYMNLRGWRESATTGEMTIKELRLYDRDGNPVTIPNAAGDPSVASVIDNDPSTFFRQADYWSWLKLDLGALKEVASIEILWGNPDINKFQLVGSPDKLRYYELLGHTYMTPYFNTMRMFARLGDDKVHTEGGHTGNTGVRLLATRNSDSKVSMLVWNHQLDGTVSQDVSIAVRNLPAGFEGKAIRYRKYIVDATSSNYAYNKQDELELAEQGTMNVTGNEVLTQTLSPNAVMLIELEAVDSSISNIVSAGKEVKLAEGSLNNLQALVDGDSISAAAAESSDYPQSVVIDLGKEYHLSGTEVEWTDSSSRGLQYTIQTSRDGQFYSTAAEVEYELGRSLNGFEDNPRARYVKLNVTGSTASGPLSINGINVYADALYKNSFETAEEQAEVEEWNKKGNSKKQARWLTVTDSVYGDTYVMPEGASVSETPVVAIFTDAQMKDTRDLGMEARLKLAASLEGSSAEMGLLARTANGGKHYFFYLEHSTSGTRVVLNRHHSNGNNEEELSSAELPESFDPMEWHTLKLEAVGDRLTGYVDGSKLIEYTDTSDQKLASGKAGLRSNLASVQFDEIKVYPIMPLLGDIQVNGQSIEGFSPYISRYSLKLPAAQSDTATVTASVYDGAHARVHPSVEASVPLGGVGEERQYTVSAMSADDNGATYYTLAMAKASEDATLSSLKLSVIPDSGPYNPGALADSDIILNPGIYEYTVKVPSRTTYVAVTEAVPTASNVATAQITDAVLTEGSGTASVKVMAEAGNVQTYTVHLEANPDAAHGAVLYEEDFENGIYNQDPSSGWKLGTAIDTANLRVVNDGGGKVLEKYTNPNMAFTVGSSAWTNYEVRARLKAVASPALPGIIARASADGRNFYMLRIHDGENGLAGGSKGYISLGRSVDGALKEYTVKMPYPYVVGKWYQLRLVVNGSRLMGYVDDKLVFDVTDNGSLFPSQPPALTQGKAGIRSANQATRFDDFAVYEPENN
ncbi:family 16 glycoside hydrolase [Paenibacillus urinalis]|uniref:family 16 glycoside hydrolase n=1 Tax=Paenibacillus urinalis TaxID=521520 RepID=UPI00196209A1